MVAIEVMTLRLVQLSLMHNAPGVNVLKEVDTLPNVLQYHLMFVLKERALSLALLLRTDPLLQNVFTNPSQVSFESSATLVNRVLSLLQRFVYDVFSICNRLPQ